MPRPSNELVDGEITEAIETECQFLWCQLDGQREEAESVAKSAADRRTSIKFAVKAALISAILTEINDKGSDLMPSIDDVKELMK